MVVYTFSLGVAVPVLHVMFSPNAMLTRSHMSVAMTIARRLCEFSPVEQWIAFVFDFINAAVQMHECQDSINSCVSLFLLPWASLVVRTLHPLGSMRAPRCPSILTTLQVGFGGMCVYTLHEKGIRREYCGVRGGQILRRLGRQTLRKQNYRHLSCEYMR